MKFNAKSKVLARLFPASQQVQTAELVELTSAELAQVSGGAAKKSADLIVGITSIHDNGEPAKDWWVKK